MKMRYESHPELGYELEPLEQALVNSQYAYCKEWYGDRYGWFDEWKIPPGWNEVPLFGWESKTPYFRNSDGRVLEELNIGEYREIGMRYPIR